MDASFTKFFMSDPEYPEPSKTTNRAQSKQSLDKNKFFKLHNKTVCVIHNLYKKGKRLSEIGLHFNPNEMVQR